MAHEQRWRIIQPDTDEIWRIIADIIGHGAVAKPEHVERLQLATRDIRARYFQ